MQDQNISRLSGRLEDQGVELLRQEFFPRRDPRTFREHYLTLLAAGGNDVKNKNKQGGAELYGIVKEDGLVAVLLVLFYDWAVLSPQLFFAVKRGGESQKIESIRLIKLRDLVPQAKGAKMACELAYFLVSDRLRGRGVGRVLFEYFAVRANEVLKCGDFLFTIQLGLHSYTDIGQRLMSYLLQREELLHGRDSVSGLVNVEGDYFPIADANAHLGLDLSEIPPHPSSGATAPLALEHRMVFLGFAKHLGWLFGKVLA